MGTAHLADREDHEQAARSDGKSMKSVSCSGNSVTDPLPWNGRVTLSSDRWQVAAFAFDGGLEHEPARLGDSNPILDIPENLNKHRFLEAWPSGLWQRF